MKDTLRQIEEWTGHREPDPPSWPGLAALLVLALLILLAFYATC